MTMRFQAPMAFRILGQASGCKKSRIEHPLVSELVHKKVSKLLQIKSNHSTQILPWPSKPFHHDRDALGEPPFPQKKCHRRIKTMCCQNITLWVPETCSSGTHKPLLQISLYREQCFGSHDSIRLIEGKDPVSHTGQPHAVTALLVRSWKLGKPSVNGLGEVGWALCGPTSFDQPLRQLAKYLINVFMRVPAHQIGERGTRQL